jgi:hypothetical protein
VLGCVALLPARTQPGYRPFLPKPVLERADLQVCHVSYSDLLGQLSFILQALRQLLLLYAFPLLVDVFR